MLPDDDLPSPHDDKEPAFSVPSGTQTLLHTLEKVEIPGSESNSRSSSDGTKVSPLTADDLWASDPHNPRNWSSGKKWQMILIVSLYTFVSPLGSSIMSPALPDIAVHYAITNQTVVAMTLSIYLLSWAFGPLLLAPLSEIYGRTWVLHICNLCLTAFNLGCAFAPTASSLIGMRFVAGFWGSAGLACGGAVVSDLFVEKDRAMAMSAFTIAPLIGAAAGPVVGGFMTETVGFKWIFILLAIICGAASVAGIPVFRETYAPVVRYRLARRLFGAEGGGETVEDTREDTMRYIWTSMHRPFILLTRSVVCFLLSLYLALVYGIYYLMFTTFPDLFANTYHFSPGISGLCYIGLGLGFFVATIHSAILSNQIYHKLSAKNGGAGKPEYRLPVVILGSFVVPIGLLWYGWSAQAGIHWIMPVIGTAIFGYGITSVTLPILLYLVDTFTYAASAVAAATALRCALAFVFPLFGEQMFRRLGFGGGNSLLAGLSIVLGIPFPVFLWIYGERIRKRSSLTRH